MKDAKDPQALVDSVTRPRARRFGGIHLEDIPVPGCFVIEDGSRPALDIPIFHDDQHGTATVALAALDNALAHRRQAPRRRSRSSSPGVGAAGVAVSKILMDAGVRNVIGR